MLLILSKWSTDVKLKKQFTALLAVPQAYRLSPAYLPQDNLRLSNLYKQYFTNLTIVLHPSLALLRPQALLRDLVLSSAQAFALSGNLAFLGTALSGDLAITWDIAFLGGGSLFGEPSRVLSGNLPFLGQGSA